MGRIDDLHTLMRLLKEFDLPVSPILEYAIKEKYQMLNCSYISSPSNSTIKEKELKIITEMQDIQNIKCNDIDNKKRIDDYVIDFSTLTVAVSKGKKLPHKAILLLGIMQMIEEGKIINNEIPLDKSISDAFVRIWIKYFDSNVPSVWTPFYHLKGEPFWHFKPKESSDILELLLNFGGTPSVGKMRPVINYAYFDEELYSLMTKSESREVLRKTLIDNYLK